jgi:hypothetical protein
MLYKHIEDNILVAIGESTAIGENDTQITQAEYDSIIELIRNKPADTEDTVYKLVAESMTYEPFEAERPEEPDNPYGIDDELYYSIIDDYTMQLLEDGIIE